MPLIVSTLVVMIVINVVLGWISAKDDYFVVCGVIAIPFIVLVEGLVIEKTVYKFRDNFFKQ